MTAHTYAALLRTRTHFAQASYRDGEWRAILGHPGENVDGTVYREVGGLLARTLTDHAGQWCVFWPEGDVAQHVRRDAVRWRDERCPGVTWIPDRPIGRANERGDAAPFFAACRGRSVVIVGPPHLARLPDAVVGPFQHVWVPDDGSAWGDAGRVASELRETMEPDDLVLFCAGMASNLIVWELWRDTFWRGRVTLLDVGAMLDPYCGVYSRSVFRDRAWRRDVLPRNLA